MIAPVKRDGFGPPCAPPPVTPRSAGSSASSHSDPSTTDRYFSVRRTLSFLAITSLSMRLKLLSITIFHSSVLVVANPANTNALIPKEFAPSISEKNITCLTRLDHNRALGQVSERLNVPVSDVKNVIIWGNHSSTQYPDVNHATVKTPAGEKPVRELVANDEWLHGEFITTVQQRGAAIIKARKLSSALSAASSACDHIRDWVHGTPEGCIERKHSLLIFSSVGTLQGTWVSMGVYSDGSYNVPAGLIYSFPVNCLPIDDLSRKKLDLTAEELTEEKALAHSCLS
ncbi:hypothetical protein TEA_026524 [Camellia sinensis var. sinensis]|uniref:Lactate/malate dehydrogenase C-terminal domain-containing protein n=1 Tax=Camellia sinensis var. sinensis TaxID=542762 RepID=A0A4S4E687_CAMSN|nr:hypothetical protein TEA_026524 [Camellia sinensis var. sinensis]